MKYLNKLISMLHTIFQNWLESLKILLHENLKESVLLIFKTIKEDAILIIKEYILIAISIIVLFSINLLLNIFLANLIFKNPIDNYLLILNTSINTCILSSILLSRPSIDYKNKIYFFINLIKIIITLVIIFIFFSLINIVINIFNLDYISPSKLILILFVLDTKIEFKEYIKSIFRTTLFIIYNYPLMFLISIIFRILIDILTYVHIKINDIFLINYIFYIMSIILLLIFSLIYTIFLVNYYTKQIHNKFLLYYNK